MSQALRVHSPSVLPSGCERRPNDPSASLLLCRHYAGDIERDRARRRQRPFLGGHSEAGNFLIGVRRKRWLVISLPGD